MRHVKSIAKRNDTQWSKVVKEKNMIIKVNDKKIQVNYYSVNYV